MSTDTLDPFAFARADDRLIEAGRRLDDLVSRWDHTVDEKGPALCDAIYREIEFINHTPPTTLAGAAVKLACWRIRITEWRRAAGMTIKYHSSRFSPLSSGRRGHERPRFLRRIIGATHPHLAQVASDQAGQAAIAAARAGHKARLTPPHPLHPRSGNRAGFHHGSALS